MRIVIVGHVDHGKSTIIGRMLADTGALPQGKLEQVKEICRRTGKTFEYAFLLDALKDERAQGITIDAARVFFESEKRKYIIIDAPGHTEFLKNMVTGASRAEAALLTIDALEGVKENSKRHGYLLSMLGIRQVAVLINKMDLVGYDEDVFQRIVAEKTEFLSSIGVSASFYVPVSGLMGDNIATSSTQMPWHDGPTVLEALDLFESMENPVDLPFRMPVQDVYRFAADGDTRRIVAGTVESGRIKVGDTVVFYPSEKTSRVKTIESFGRDEPPVSAEAGFATGFTLEEQIYVRRGEIATVQGEKVPIVGNRLRANLFWLGKKPLVKGKRYTIKIGTAKVQASLDSVHQVLDATDLTRRQNATRIERHDVAECSFLLENDVACDMVGASHEALSRFVVVDDYEIAGGGLVLDVLKVPRHVYASKGRVTYEERSRILGQRGVVVWMTGLSGSGKSTIAAEVEKRLAAMGRATYRLDGDNVRLGLNSDLRFSDEDREENIRRMAEVAALFKDAGLITLVSVISPFKRMRDFARSRVKPGEFIEVYVHADVETCEARDPKGLYKKARSGEILDFTGISSPYEIPENPDVYVDTERLSVDESADLIMDAVVDVIYRAEMVNA